MRLRKKRYNIGGGIPQQPEDPKDVNALLEMLSSYGTPPEDLDLDVLQPLVSESTQPYGHRSSLDPFTQQIGIVYGDSSNYYYLRSGKVSGASITWSTAIQVDPSTVNKHVNVVNANSLPFSPFVDSGLFIRTALILVKGIL